MSDMSYAPPPAKPAGTWSLGFSILSGVVLALLAGNIYLFVQLDRVRTELAKFRDTTMTELTNLRETTSVTTAANRRHLEDMKEELEAARRQASMAVGQAKTEALAKAEALTKKLADEQRRQHAQVTSQISEVKQATTEAQAQIGQVNQDVTGVKSDVANTKAELDKTISQLKGAVGDMGVMSGLIATNGKELAALKALGDRNYFEFNLRKSKAPQKVGDIAIQLKKADQKKNRFTIQVVADDKSVEKKDKNLNEPVQFYTSKARQPYEIVVNQVNKDQIAGYLATPKVQNGR